MATNRVWPALEWHGYTISVLGIDGVTPVPETGLDVTLAQEYPGGPLMLPKFWRDLILEGKVRLDDPPQISPPLEGVTVVSASCSLSAAAGALAHGIAVGIISASVALSAAAGATATGQALGLRNGAVALSATSTLSPQGRALKSAAVAFGATASTVATPTIATSGRTNMSINIPQVTYYDATIQFLDLVKQAPDWGYGGYAGSLTAGGYPTSVTSTNAGFQARIPAAGQYVAKFDGTGTLAIDFGGTLVSNTSNRYIFNLTGDDLGGNDNDRVGFYITASSAGDPVRNLVVVPIAHESDHATVLMNEKFKEIIAPFQVLRFMDFFRINDLGDAFNDTTTWASRITSTYGIQGGTKGPALEYAIQICNLNNSDLWINIPLYATTNWVDNAATLIASTLNSPLKCYIEYGNEIWNDAFQNGNDAYALGVSAGFPSTGDFAYDTRFGYQNMMGRYMREKLTTALGSGTRVKHVITSQTTFDDRQIITLDFPYSYGLYSDGDLAYEHADMYATAPYFSVERGDDPATVTDSVATILGKMSAIDIPSSVAAFNDSAGFAAARGLPFGAYEAGQHLFYWDGSATSLQNKLDSVNRDSGMYAVMKGYLDDVLAIADAPFCYYMLCNEYSQYGRWGAMETMYSAVTTGGSPKMKAIRDWISEND